MALKTDWQDGDAFSADDMNDVATAVNDNTSAIAGKADAVHTHNAADITGGQLSIARIPTGTSAQTVCIGNDARLSDTRTPTDNTVSTAKIQNGAVTEAKIANGAVTTGKIGDGQVTSAKIADGTIVNADINSSAGIAVSKLGTGRVAGYANGAASNLDFDILTESQWDALGSPVAGRIYLIFED